MPTKRKTTKKGTRTTKKTARRPATQKRTASRRRTATTRKQRESGMPGGGAGRREEVGGSGVYPASGPLPPEDAPYKGMASWGQGEQGAAGYEDSGGSEPGVPEMEEERRRANQNERVSPNKEGEPTRKNQSKPSQPGTQR